MHSLANLGLFIGDLRMPFTEEGKYCILSISVILFLIALGVMVWQLFRYFSQTVREPVDEFISSDCQPAETAVFYKETQSPNVMVEAQLKEAQRLSRCLSMDNHLELPSLEGQEQEEVKGSLRFSLYYDQLHSRLVVTILEARELPLRDFSHGVHPFVRVWLLWAGHKKEGKEVRFCPSLNCVLHEWESRTVKNNSSPMFGDQFSCSLEEEEIPHITVRFEVHNGDNSFHLVGVTLTGVLGQISIFPQVRDFDKFSRHGILGEVRVHLCDMKTSYPLEFLEDLQTPQKDLVGEVLLSLKYLHTLQRLEVGLLKIRAPQPSSQKEKALYARISVLCNQFKLQPQKSTVKTRWKVTAFNEVMMFTLPDSQIRECSVVVTVYEIHAAKKSSKLLVGQVAFGKTKNSHDEHWSLMMRSVCQPVAQWHPLLI